MSSADVDIWFDLGREGQFKLPVLPADLVFFTPSGNESTETIRLGEITLLRQRRLREFSISSFLPRSPAPSWVRTKDKFFKPEFYLGRFQGLMENKKPTRFIVTGLGMKAFYVSVESFEFRYVAQDDDVHYTLSLKEYRHFAARGREVTVVDPLFSDSDSVGMEVQEVDRPKSGFAVGDKVIVSGPCFRDAWGGMAFVQTPTNFLTYSPMSLAWDIFDALRNAPTPLMLRRCTIINLESDANRLMMGFDLGAGLTVIAPYQIADDADRLALGWVMESSMVHA
jgi:hypothetical protein